MPGSCCAVSFCEVLLLYRWFSGSTSQGEFTQSQEAAAPEGFVAWPRRLLSCIVDGACV